MGIYDNQIVASRKDRYQVVCSLIKAMVDSESEIITLMIGNDVPPEESELLSNFLEKEFSVEIEIIDGGQEIYSYIIAVE
jgi:dihydroxyacetone kinase-like predicted kinase